MSEPLNEPILAIAQCAWTGCMHRWRTFLPDGVDDPDALECPKCHKFNGYLVNDSVDGGGGGDP